ncbi:MAG TPA: phospholipase D-like domain-containing protein [Thermoanaerobaculia bacterium]|nr:phospholipase D-like domain-containing protein [Thermoanaerobaculia bacterium]
MFRTRRRGPRSPRVYRIPVETYLVALALAFALAIAFSLLSAPKEVSYRQPHRFAVADETFLPSALALSNPQPSEGNRVRLLFNGEEIFPAMLAAIARAERSVNLESYIFWSGQAATRFRNALVERAQHGVEVRVLLDALGSPRSKLRRQDVEFLREGGCRVEFYHPIRPWMLDTINHRSHRRILVVDGKVAFTGGAGIADVWLGQAEAPGRWRDTHVEVTGPVVAQLQSAFQENWGAVRGEALAGDAFFPKLERAGSARAQVIVSSPESPSSATKLLYATSISAATKRLWLSNSYFLPDSDTSALLVEAARRGVDVHILVPGKVNDVPATKAGGRSSFGELLSGGVKISEYQPTMFHPKTMVVDGLFATIGSTNFDNRSFRLNDEINLAVYDRDVGRRLEEIFEKDLARSRRYTLEQWRGRPIRERLTELLIMPFRSEL